ncbi:phosphate/phosphite/phosphonate ABC transporter substrate-binding protein [Thioalkalivibrio paradoxus]|uniref:Phosphate ABC transporter substrate-binding protein n=1 Tax=Thioalkalivibrio paradoxus ARh 1 TaxID=713585 RepID=W0DFD0_9GAMM|nr:phosphate/phosphite/phosphonate ABC transporter substrate-binding protein [Thioalkalivibrio paradoxus]AHE97071.1 phosphate ABC transporter substrate-binding protein [Thioalkalivibrio paradoxus ARh 1]
MNDIVQMTASPDFPTKRIPGWFFLNTWLQKALETRIHLEIYQDFEQQREAIQSGRVDIIYANPFDAAMLVREQNFVPLVRPSGRSDECIVAVAAQSPIQAVEDLKPGCRLVRTADPDVNLVGMILLEPADLHEGNVKVEQVESYPLVAKALLRGNADVGFFLEESYDELTGLVRNEMRPLVRSQIFDIWHVLLVGPRLSERHEEIRQVLLGMANDPSGADILKELGFSSWENVEHEDTEFMIDLMDTLKIS